MSAVERGELGYGCMSLSPNIYATPEGFDDTQGLKLLNRALELGVTHFDTAIIYGNGHNERLVGKMLAGLSKEQRAKLCIATKTGFDTSKGKVSGDPEFIRRTCMESLERLGVECIDLFYLHRIDTSIPIEETMEELKKLIGEGKIKAIGLSEASANTIRRAHAVHPITAVQLEWSLWARDVEEEVIPTCRKLGIKIVAYSPLGRGALTGAIKKRSDLPENDWRLKNPRFTDEAIAKHNVFIEKIEAMAKRKGSNCSAAKLSLAWVLAQGSDVIAIPGTAKIAHLEENMKTLDIHLSAEEVKELSLTVPPEEIVGERYQSGIPTFKDN